MPLLLVIFTAVGLLGPFIALAQPSVTGEWICTWIGTTRPTHSCSMKLEQTDTKIEGTYSLTISTRQGATS
ncbi:MAG TPA: hypothetical protein VGT40_05395 [Methylomirabilota bacterium]|nr:hypothetical protein [Methylomirabilota bacterium]